MILLSLYVHIHPKKKKTPSLIPFSPSLIILTQLATEATADFTLRCCPGGAVVDGGCVGISSSAGFVDGGCTFYIIFFFCLRYRWWWIWYDDLRWWWWLFCLTWGNSIKGEEVCWWRCGWDRGGGCGGGKEMGIFGFIFFF